ncbi:hypothetical protein [Bacillus sp. OTU530]|uniref:hypothetical protein n=1 Tax=Bacillus sp. OTU530 TaxID=3043862 RepID=UPI00313DC9EE
MNKFLLRLLMCVIFFVGYMAFTGNWGILDDFKWMVTHPAKTLSNGWQIIKVFIIIFVIFVIIPIIGRLLAGDTIEDKLDRIEDLLRRK